MSLARLTSLSTQTLTLLLERQRLQTLPASTSDPHLGQIRKGLSQLREGVLELEDKEGVSEASKLFRTQYERMRAMLAADAVEQDIPRCVLFVVGLSRSFVDREAS